jgi:two-component system, sensor histidine kinase and response regulator
LGIAAYLSKLVKQSELLDAILTVLGTSGRRPEARTALVTQHSLRESRPRRRILLAEDSAVNQVLTVRLLERRGHTVAVAATGREVLTALEREGFDLVLMDVQMPEMDGLEATAAIRQREQQTGTHIPIIAVTAHAMEGDRERCLAAGMDAYLTKPFRADELFHMLERLTPDPGVPRVSAPVEMPTEAVFDRAAALARVDDDAALLREMAKVFVASYPQQISEIQQAIDKGDPQALITAAHTLKGPLGIFAAHAAYEAALKLETIGHQGDMSQAQEAYTSLQRAMECLIHALATEAECPWLSPDLRNF